MFDALRHNSRFVRLNANLKSVFKFMLMQVDPVEYPAHSKVQGHYVTDKMISI
jgi:hypothetical protein